MDILKNRVYFGTSTTGTGAITVGTAESGFRTLAQGGYVENNTFPYVIEDGAAWETGIGTVGASAATFTRSVRQSSNSDALISLSGSAKVKVTFLAETYDDIVGGELALSVVGTDTQVGASPLTFTKPAGTQDGDLIFLALMTTNTVPNVNGPQNDNSWSEVLRFDTSSNEWQCIWTKVASSEPSTWTLTHSAGIETAAVLVVFRGPTTLYNSGQTTDSLTAPSIVSRKTSVQVCVFMTTTQTVDLTIPSFLTQDGYIKQTSTNNPRVLVGHRLCNYEVCPQFTAGGAPSAVYGIGWSGIFY